MLARWFLHCIQLSNLLGLVKIVCRRCKRTWIGHPWEQPWIWVFKICWAIGVVGLHVATRLVVHDVAIVLLRRRVRLLRCQDPPSLKLSCWIKLLHTATVDVVLDLVHMFYRLQLGCRTDIPLDQFVLHHVYRPRMRTFEVKPLQFL